MLAHMHDATTMVRPKDDELDLFGIKQKQKDLAVACQSIRERFGPRGLMRAHDWILENESPQKPKRGYTFSRG